MIAKSRFQQSGDCNYESLTTDRDLELKVQNAIHRNAMIDSEKIRIWVSGRRVYLEGKVRSESERYLAQECISDIFGIRNIINYITFSRSYSY
ncbi:BON domain-containing protein [Dyadobacter sp. NIV53]|uniref:BON domain-containing protein n=1 Tax=Dyadobacter sp. NIV53 TaxID=2861765 RepID=UPI001C87BC7D|nr:BON domain-containing protein [Dyadobacter sp. NIV53]